MIEELCALVEGKEWAEAWFLTIGLTVAQFWNEILKMDIPELEVNIGRGEIEALKSYYIG